MIRYRLSTAPYADREDATPAPIQHFKATSPNQSKEQYRVVKNPGNGKDAPVRKQAPARIICIDCTESS